MDDTREAAWNAALVRLEKFVAEHRRMPQATESDGHSPKLGPWYRGQLRGRNQSPGRVALLDQRVPGWRGSGQDARWEQMLSRLSKFVSTHGRLPLYGESDELDGSLSYWLTHQRTQPNLNPDRQKAIDTTVPMWRESSSRHLDDVFELNLARTESWITKTGKYPTAKSSDGQPGSNLGAWLSRLRKGKGLTPAREEQLNERLPHWRGVSFEEAIDRLIAFVSEHGRSPQNRESDGIYGPHLGSWLSTQRKNQDLSPERKAMLDAAVPGWRGTASPKS